MLKQKKRPYVPLFLSDTYEIFKDKYNDLYYGMALFFHKMFV